MCRKETERNYTWLNLQQDKTFLKDWDNNLPTKRSIIRVWIKWLSLVYRYYQIGIHRGIHIASHIAWSASVYYGVWCQPANTKLLPFVGQLTAEFICPWDDVSFTQWTNNLTIARLITVPCVNVFYMSFFR